MTQSVQAATDTFAPALPLAIALSGGVDSVALLTACARKWPGQVVAWHVNHGLQAAALDFERHCRVVCAQLQVPLAVQSVYAQAAPGQSPEDAARQARYKAFDVLARTKHGDIAIQSVAIAQHADDQVETLLLALSRGAGLAGMSAMPMHWQRAGFGYYRPWLRVAGADIRAWAIAQGLSWVEDPTNADARYTRNRIRARLMPVLCDVFPQFLDTFTRSAAHTAQAQDLLDEVAASDLRTFGDVSGVLPVVPLQTLSRARQANGLRHWLKVRFGVVPTAAQLEELLDQVEACTTRGHRIRIKVGAGYVQGSRQGLTWYNP